MNPIWLVPVVITNWPGRRSKKTIPVYGKFNEWRAQNAAIAKARHKNYQIASISADHAISFETRSCVHGCCSVNR